MSEDRYECVAKTLKNFGWLLDFILRNTRKYIVEVLKAQKFTSVLDACCGAGTLSIYLHNSGLNATGVDASPSMLALARKKTNDINFIEADLTNFDMEDKVDAAVIAFSIHEMEEELRVKIWETMKRLTKQGGVLVIADFAETERKSFPSKISWWFMWNDEKNIGKHDPGHFESFKEFMEKGGVKNWLITKNEEIIEEKYFQWGNIGVIAVKN
jgi:ubiquinone/menaquinone biosynthesis C-methylase UbiE